LLKDFSKTIKEVSKIKLTTTPSESGMDFKLASIRKQQLKNEIAKVKML
jgi:hypothetical protein